MFVVLLVARSETNCCPDGTWKRKGFTRIIISSECRNKKSFFATIESDEIDRNITVC